MYIENNIYLLTALKQTKTYILHKERIFQKLFCNFFLWNIRFHSNFIGFTILSLQQLLSKTRHRTKFSDEIEHIHSSS